MEQRSRYEYQPLTSSHEIRLIILKRNKTPSPLKCRIFHAELTQELPYLALSYTWGASSQLKPLLIDGQELHIRTNLWWALWHLREDMRMSSKGHETRSFPKYMWIDAVCINQVDIAERNHQVRLMSQIFGCASEVLAWLGIEADESKLAMEALQGVCEPHLWSDALKAMAKLLNREYWTRMWIIQELGLADKITLQCGGQSVDWGSIVSLQSERYIDASIEVEMNEIQKSHAVRLFRQWSNQKRDDSPTAWQSYHGHGESLQGLLETFRDSKCSDPRDKIFALLGLAKDCQNDEILPDYSKSIIEVYVEVIYHCNITITEYSTRRFMSFSRMLFDSLGLQSVDQNFIKEALESESSKMRPLLQAMFYGSCRIQETSPSFERQSLKSSLKVEIISDGQSDTDPDHLRPFPDLLATSLHVEGYLPDDPGESGSVRWIRLENGLYGLAPIQASKGDAIYRLPQWHIAVVLRKCHHRKPWYHRPVASHTLVGRAIILPRGSTLETTSSEVLVRICRNRDEEFGEPENMLSWPGITFLDIATLYKLIA
jgi:Heterokaryon incompatibility protein (HET)